MNARMDDFFFSDREQGPLPRTTEEIDETLWGGIWNYINGLLSRNFFALDYPEYCGDKPGVIAGTNEDAFHAAYQAMIPGISTDLAARLVPYTLPILDLIEFCYQHVAIPEQGNYHSYWGHYHIFDFDRDNGKEDFRNYINLLFSRNQLAFVLQENGQIERLAPPILDEVIHSVRFDTGDEQLDKMLENARERFLSPEPDVHGESLEKLWDAWERLKTLESGDKKHSAAKNLEIASPDPALRERLETEASALTKIGNEFMIRHSETDKHPIVLSEHVDYLFHRMFALIYLILQQRSKLEDTDI